MARRGYDGKELKTGYRVTIKNLALSGRLEGLILDGSYSTPHKPNLAEGRQIGDEYRLYNGTLVRVLSIEVSEIVYTDAADLLMGR